MAQTIRISAGYADKASENYNSKQYSINLELDVQVNGNTREIEGASDRLFELCRRIVEKQKVVSVDNLLAGPPEPHAEEPNSGNSNGTTRPATAKQLRYLHQLAKKANLTDEQVNGLPRQYYSKAALSDLTSLEASGLIDVLSQKKAA